tara:strand:- start:691 stop:1281 length:591 start_codon:yes stop_codon:yes gene_type:complete
LEIGHYIIYDVHETIYSAGQATPAVNVRQEKDEVDRILDKSEFSTTYIIARYQRKSPTENWQKTKEFTITKSPDKILTNLDNRTVFSLVFPMDLNLKWNGNTYNNQDPQNFKYSEINQPIDVGSLKFTNGVTVIEKEDSSIINKYQTIKQYALGVGLVSAEQTAIEYCQDDHCIGDYIIESGFRTSRIINSYNEIK